jgi:hypothetical protein
MLCRIWKREGLYLAPEEGLVFNISEELGKLKETNSCAVSRTVYEFVILCCSETEATLHVAQSSVSSLRTAVVQPV